MVKGTEQPCEHKKQLVCKEKSKVFIQKCLKCNKILARWGYIRDGVYIDDVYFDEKWPSTDRQY